MFSVQNLSKQARRGLGHNLLQNATNIFSIYMLGAFEYYTTYQHMFAMSEKQFNFMRKRFEKCADVM